MIRPWPDDEIPDQAIPVSHVRAYIEATSIGEDHYAQIAEVSGITASDTVTAVLATSAKVGTIRCSSDPAAQAFAYPA